MHLTPRDGSQSPEGQTGAETYERGGLRTASSRSRDALMAILRRRTDQLPRWITAAAALPGTQPGSATPAGGRQSNTHSREQLFGHRDRHQGAAGGRGPLRPPDAPLEPQDAPLHIRRARRDPHHRPAEDRAPAAQRPRSSPASSPGRGGTDPVRGHQEAGPRHDQGSRGQLRHALHRPALAGRAAHQLPDHQQAHPAPARPARLDRVAARWTCCRSASASPRWPSATSSRRTSAAWPTCSARPTRCSWWT